MARKKAALIGRFEFTSIYTLIERLKQVAAYFSPGLNFSTYLVTFKSQSYYGLDYAELASAFEEHESNVKSLTSNCRVGEDASVSVSVRYLQKGGKAETQFVISSDSNYDSKQVRNILRGEYEPLSEDQVWSRAYLGELMGNLIETKQKEAAREAAKLEALALASMKKVSQEKNGVEKIKRATSDNRRLGKRHATGLNTIKPVRDRFSFDPVFSAELIVEMLTRISEHLLRNAPFHIKVISTNGQPFSNIGFKGLKLFLEKRRRSVRTLMMDAATPQGEWVNIVINFEKDNVCRAEVEIFAKRGKMIQSMIRDFLERTSEVNLKTASMVHEMFRFDEKAFSLDKVSKLISTISHKYLKKEAATAFLSTSSGETYPALTLRQLRSVFNQKNQDISFLLYGINQVDTGQTFSLMFQFESPFQKAYGSLSMMWGSHETHQVVRALVWEQLNLKPYRQGNQAKEPGLEVPVVVKPSPPLPEAQTSNFKFNPIFKKRDFKYEPLTALILMPLEAYWSESVWLHLKESLRELGYHTRKADSIYSKDTLEPNWTDINESELIIADLTYKHPDVFYKIGMAHTLGKKVILTTQHVRDLPGDFKRFPFIVYDNNLYGLQDLKSKLLSLLKEMR